MISSSPRRMFSSGGAGTLSKIFEFLKENLITLEHIRDAMVIISKFFFYRNYVGVSIWPFIILKHSGLAGDSVLINHERIHLRQQAEMLILPFYLLYFLEWSFKCLFYLNFYKAYRNLSFEREAYQNESNPEYLLERKRFAFTRYLWRAQ